MPEIIIRSKGIDYICLFDIQDQDLVCRYRWSLHSAGYAQTTINKKSVLMHRLILGIIDNPEIEADHKFHNKLDNRRAKIRICTHSENRRNSRKLKESSQSQYKGVYRDQNKWHAQIMQGDRVKNLGRFRSEVTAGKVYDNEARQEYKDFAFLNFPDFKEVNQLSISGF